MRFLRQFRAGGNANTATGLLHDRHAHPLWRCHAHHIAGNLRCEGFTKNTGVAEGDEVEFQGLRFDAEDVWTVRDLYLVR